MKLTLELKVTRPAPKIGQRREEMRKNVKNDFTIKHCQVHTCILILFSLSHLLGILVQGRSLSRHSRRCRIWS